MPTFWQMVWQKLDDIGLVPVEARTGNGQLLVTKVKAHRTVGEKQEMKAGELARTALNEFADEWAKAGARLRAPPQWRVKASDESHAKAKRILEFIAHFRVGLGGARTSSLLPRQPGRKKRGAFYTPQAAPPVRPHTQWQEGHIWRCTKCMRSAFTRDGKRRFRREECKGWKTLVPRAAAPAAELARVAAAAAGVESSHMLLLAGPYIFCRVCGAYAKLQARGLKSRCHGYPLSEAPADVGRRRRRNRLEAGRDPITGGAFAGEEERQGSGWFLWR